MPRGRKKLVEEPKEEKDTEVPVEDENVSQTEFSVFDGKGEFVRTYSIELQGENAKELAEMYAKKIGGNYK